MYHVLVVDDERPARAKAVRLLHEDGRFGLAGEAPNGLDALRLIEVLHPDVVLLDIQMPGINGFEVLEAVGSERNFEVVFSTAYEEYALRAFDVHALDYLLKPYDSERFQRALDRVYAQLAASLAASRAARPSYAGLVASARDQQMQRRLVVKTADGEWITLEIDAIVRVSAANKHVCLFLPDACHLVRQSLREIMTRLDVSRFVRVHRSEIVNIDAVTRFESLAHGDGLLVLLDGSTVPLTRSYRNSFLELFRR